MRLANTGRIHIVNGLLNRIGNYSPSSFLRSFSSRLIFQKTIYLLQACGIFIGYQFTWYIHGPYSSGLARAGYELAMKRFRGTATVRFLHASSEEKFQNLLRFLGDRRDDADWLETTASLHFLRRIHPDWARREIISVVLSKQPHLTVEECLKAWNHLEEHGLLGQG